MSDPENDNDLQLNPEAVVPTRSIVQIYKECIGEKNTPVLNAMVAGAEGGAVRRELMWLIRQLVPHRSPREKVKVIAKLVREVSGTQIESPVVIRDISTTGVQLAISKHLGLCASDLPQIRLRMRLPKTEDFVVSAKLARIIRSDSNFILAGFRFDELSDDAAQALHLVQHTPSIRVAAFSEVTDGPSDVPLPATTRAASGTTGGEAE